MGYTINWNPAPSGVFTAGRRGCKAEWIIIHYTATNASAYNNSVYMARGGSGSGSWHYCLDDKAIYQAVADKDAAWCCGQYQLNLRSINIEVVSDGSAPFPEETIKRLAWLVQRLMAQYGIKADHVIRHYDNYAISTMLGLSGSCVDPYKRCPAQYVDNSKWLALRNRITGASTSNTSDNPRVEAKDVKAYFFAMGASAAIRQLTDFSNLENNKIIGTIPKGDYAPLTGDFATILIGGYQYIGINYRGIEGFVQADFTSRDGDTNYLLCSEPEKLK